MRIRRPLQRGIGLFLLAAVVCWVSTSQSMAGDAGFFMGRHQGTYAGDLFPSYWAPAAPGGVSAPLYVSPIPTPPHVGHVWVTYQPLYPHEFLYKHSKVYWRQNPQGGWTRVVVGWY